MKTDPKLRPLYLAQILYERTDEDHYLTTAELMEILEKEYGFKVHRQTIPADVAALRSFGMEIQEVMSSQKRYNLIHARNGIEAVTMNEEEHPDIILMDVRMPEMDGLDATRIIKEVNNKVPIIILSAYAFPENIREAKAAGCDEFMAKPFNVEDLIEKINHFIGS